MKSVIETSHYFNERKCGLFLESYIRKVLEEIIFILLFFFNIFLPPHEVERETMEDELVCVLPYFAYNIYHHNHHTIYKSMKHFEYQTWKEIAELLLGE